MLDYLSTDFWQKGQKLAFRLISNWNFTLGLGKLTLLCLSGYGRAGRCGISRVELEIDFLVGDESEEGEILLGIIA